jgi:hypothetical protein
MVRWWKKHKPAPMPQELRISEVTFIAEQDGDAERELKARLLECFRTNINLHEAFLVQLRYGTSEELKVALCLSAGRPDSALVRTAALEFSNMFGTHESLDILFLEPEQLREIARVAKPFYRQSSYRA